MMRRLNKTAAAIHRAALEMTDEFGFDGWTMEHLADRVGVSRRTLFNHVPSKMDAVLGPEQEPDPELLEAFLSGGPTGHVGRDLGALVRTVLDAEPIDHDELVLVRHILATDRQVLDAARTRFEQITVHFAEVISEREGDQMTPELAGVVLHLVIVVFNASLDAYLANPSAGTVADHFTRIFDDLVDLF
ncbi:TetR/AcrR family transcriptional regulator [Nocardioides sp. YJ-D4]